MNKELQELTRLEQEILKLKKEQYDIVLEIADFMNPNDPALQFFNKLQKEIEEMEKHLRAGLLT